MGKQDINTIALNKNTLIYLDKIEGKTTQDKINSLIKNKFLFMLKECEEFIYQFEAKYGMEFKEFKNNWIRNKIRKKYSYEIEKDYMEWEGFVAEKNKLFFTLKKLKNDKI